MLMKHMILVMLMMTVLILMKAKKLIGVGFPVMTMRNCHHLLQPMKTRMTMSLACHLPRMLLNSHCTATRREGHCITPIQKMMILQYATLKKLPWSVSSRFLRSFPMRIQR